MAGLANPVSFMILNCFLTIQRLPLISCLPFNYFPVKYVYHGVKEKKGSCSFVETPQNDVTPTNSLRHHFYTNRVMYETRFRARKEFRIKK